ncbi:MAG: hypothetical protein F6K55_08855 [Moorea sp. SIO4A3]|nr:hypothetical protein [Moorena sp. SIO4A3]
MNLFTRLLAEVGNREQRCSAVLGVSPTRYCIKTGTGNSGQELTQSDASLSYAPHPTPHPLHPTPEVKVKNLPL